MQLQKTLTFLKYYNKKNLKKKSHAFHEMMEGASIIKFKFFCTIVFWHLINVCKF